jgi:hypothetical protein
VRGPANEALPASCRGRRTFISSESLGGSMTAKEAPIWGAMGNRRWGVRLVCHHSCVLGKSSPEGSSGAKPGKLPVYPSR